MSYLAFVIGLLVILQTAGIDLTTLNVLAGAIGIGVGFGLQNIVNNFVSGLMRSTGSRSHTHSGMCAFAAAPRRRR